MTSLGGTARPAFDVLDQGRMAVCFDPTGAEFDIWEPKKMPGTDVDSALHGVPSWFETRTTDVDRATGFYSGLFGWTPEVMPMPGPDYTAFKNAGTDVAGMMEITPEMVGIQPHWATYFTVNDADAAARRRCGSVPSSACHSRTSRASAAFAASRRRRASSFMSSSIRGEGSRSCYSTDRKTKWVYN